MNTHKGIYGRDFHPQTPITGSFNTCLGAPRVACVSRLETEGVTEELESPVVLRGARDALLLAEFAERVGDRGRTARVAARLGDLRVAEAPQASEHEALVPAASLGSDGVEHVGRESDSGGGSHGFMWSACGSCVRKVAGAV